MIPVSVIIMTKNEADNLPHTLTPLINHFDDIHIVDSHSADNTVDIALAHGAQVTQFKWNSQYPKKKQWGVDNLSLKYPWILQLDADESVTDDFIDELHSLDFTCDGYFVRANMRWNGRFLHHGQQNNKLCLYHKDRFKYPVVDDLKSDGGWEVEGHYQPCPTIKNARIGQMKSPLWHTDTAGHWVNRHQKYIIWERDMTLLDAWPKDPVWWRAFTKQCLRNTHVRAPLFFLYGYVWKRGFMDGKAGLDYAMHRYRYNRGIVRAIRHSSLKSKTASLQPYP